MSVENLRELASAVCRTGSCDTCETRAFLHFDGPKESVIERQPPGHAPVRHGLSMDSPHR